MIGCTLRWGVRLAALALAAHPGAAAAQQKLTGAGATFPNPIYTKWFDAYHKKTGIEINYQSIGSGGGIRQFTEGTVDFGASDAPLTDAQVAAVQGNVVHVPTVIGAVVLTYNLPALRGTQLKLDGQTIADLYLGRITKWNDRRIASLNPGVALPDLDLVVVHRSDGSGTTYVFTDYLSKVSAEWREKVGYATSVSWPAGLGGKGNEGVTQQVRQVEGAIGYVELIYAVANRLPYALVRNSAGNFVAPSLESATAAAASARLKPGTDFRVSITNAPGPATYPITSFTWILVRADDKHAARARLLRDVLLWTITDEAQEMARALHYAPLPAEVRALVAARVKSLKADGKPIATR